MVPSVKVSEMTWPHTYPESLYHYVSFLPAGTVLLVVDYRDLVTDVAWFSQGKRLSYHEHTGNIFCCYRRSLLKVGCTHVPLMLWLC